MGQSILACLNKIITFWNFYVFMILVSAIVMRESRSIFGQEMASSEDVHIQNDVHFVAQPLDQTMTSLEDACIEENGGSSSMSTSYPSWNDGKLRVNEYIFDEIFCEKSRCAQLILIGILLSIACTNACKDVIDIRVLFSARTRQRLKCFKEDVLLFLYCQDWKSDFEFMRILFFIMTSRHLF